MPITNAEFFRGVDSVTARATNRSAIRNVQAQTGGMAQFVAPLILDRSPHTPGVSNIDQALNGYAQPPSSAPLLEFRPTPYSNTEVRGRLSLYGVRVPEHLGRRLSAVIIGTGAAGIVSGRVLSELGFDRVTYVSPDAEPGGLWVDEDKWGEIKPYGYNNPTEVSFLNAHLPIETFRRTDVVHRFLHNAADPRIREKTVRGSATGIIYNPVDKSHTVHYQDQDGKDKELPPADIVFVATGQRPLPLTDGYIGLSDTELVPMKRWPKLLTRDEAREYNTKGQRVLCLGWGNSSMARAREVYRINQLYGYDIDVVVLTHLSRDALNQPHVPFRQPDGHERSLARDPRRGELTRLELDLFQSLDIFQDMRREEQDASGNVLHGTIADVVSVRFEKGENGSVHAKILTRNKRTGIEREVTVPDIGEFDAFIGFGNDSSEMKDFGLTVIDDRRGTVKLRTYDGKADTTDGRNVLLVGAVGATRDDASAKVLPGAVRRAKEGGVTAICTAAELLEAA